MLFSIVGGKLLRYLSEVPTEILNDTACRSRYQVGMINTNTQLCSGGNDKGACQVRKLTVIAFMQIFSLPG